MIFNTNNRRFRSTESHLINGLYDGYFRELGTMLVGCTEYASIYNDTHKCTESVLVEESELEVGLTVGNPTSTAYIKGKGYFKVDATSIVKEFIFGYGNNVVIVKAEVEGRTIYSATSLVALQEFYVEFLQGKIKGEFIQSNLETLDSKGKLLLSSLAPVKNIKLDSYVTKIQLYKKALELFETFNVPIVSSFYSLDKQIQRYTHQQNKEYMELESISIVKDSVPWHLEYISRIGNYNNQLKYFKVGEFYVYKDGTVVGTNKEELESFLDLVKV